MAGQNGRAKIYYGEDNVLTDLDGNAVVGLNSEGTWTVRYHKPPQESSAEAPTVLFIYHPDDNKSSERALTLSDDSQDGWTNIVVQPVEDPPSPSQLWTLEEMLMQFREPPIVHARIQSVKDNKLSAGIGDKPLPRLYRNVAGVPNEPGSESQRWRLDYLLLE